MCIYISECKVLLHLSNSGEHCWSWRVHHGLKLMLDTCLRFPPSPHLPPFLILLYFKRDETKSEKNYIESYRLTRNLGKLWVKKQTPGNLMAQGSSPYSPVRGSSSDSPVRGKPVPHCCMAWEKTFHKETPQFPLSSENVIKEFECNYPKFGFSFKELIHLRDSLIV